MTLGVDSPFANPNPWRRKSLAEKWHNALVLAVFFILVFAGAACLVAVMSPDSSLPEIPKIDEAPGIPPDNFDGVFNKLDTLNLYSILFGDLQVDPRFRASYLDMIRREGVEYTKEQTDAQDQTIKSVYRIRDKTLCDTADHSHCEGLSPFIKNERSRLVEAFRALRTPLRRHAYSQGFSTLQSLCAAERFISQTESTLGPRVQRGERRFTEPIAPEMADGATQTASAGREKEQQCKCSCPQQGANQTAERKSDTDAMASRIATWLRRGESVLGSLVDATVFAAPKVRDYTQQTGRWASSVWDQLRTDARWKELSRKLARWEEATAVDNKKMESATTPTETGNDHAKPQVGAEEDIIAEEETEEEPPVQRSPMANDDHDTNTEPNEGEDDGADTLDDDGVDAPDLYRTLCGSTHLDKLLSWRGRSEKIKHRELRKCWRRRVRAFQAQDKSTNVFGLTAANFYETLEAFEILSNTNLRKLYHQAGPAAAIKRYRQKKSAWSSASSFRFDDAKGGIEEF